MAWGVQGGARRACREVREGEVRLRRPRVVGKEICHYSQNCKEPLQGLKQVGTVHEEGLSGNAEGMGRGGEVLGVCPGHSLV